MESTANILAISGGVGGAKLALGLAQVVAAERLTIVANTGDDFIHLGFPVSPDLDTVMYTLAGLSNTELGWGLAGETWQFMDAVHALGGETWFRLGDKDIATHTLRRQMLDQGQSLSQVTASLCRSLGVMPSLIPMSDDSVATQVFDGQQWLEFQDYFVRQQCAPDVTAIRFNGIDSARPASGLDALLKQACESADALDAIIICPSNPFLSIDPVLSIPSVADRLRQAQAPVIAVCPIVAGQAIKGPTAKMMDSLSMPVSALGVANYYTQQYPQLLDGFVIDHADAMAAPDIEALGLKVLLANSVMRSDQDKANLASDCIAFASHF